ncbi:MAG: hypothetical protein ACOVQA_01815 [Thermoflexibacteraceae bacterium]|jgi:hypothetical protein
MKKKKTTKSNAKAVQQTPTPEEVQAEAKALLRLIGRVILVLLCFLALLIGLYWVFD